MRLDGGEYCWMAGSLIKYGASEPLKTAGDVPVDSRQLLAMCAPRPCFISKGTVENGDAKWVDGHGRFKPRRLLAAKQKGERQLT